MYLENFISFAAFDGNERKYCDKGLWPSSIFMGSDQANFKRLKPRTRVNDQGQGV